MATVHNAESCPDKFFPSGSWGANSERQSDKAGVSSFPGIVRVFCNAFKPSRNPAHSAMDTRRETLSKADCLGLAKLRNMRTLIGMRITWDPAKNDANQARHHISFEDAAKVFALPEQFRFTGYDIQHSDDEDRWISVGLIDKGVVVVVYVIRGSSDDEYRIISARIADPDERRAYADHLAGGAS